MIFLLDISVKKSSTMGTRGILSIYDKTTRKWSTYFVQYDSKMVLIAMRKKLLTIKTHKSFWKAIVNFMTEYGIEIDHELSHEPNVSVCWPFLEYVLTVSLEQDGRVFVDRVVETLKTEFVVVKGQRNQDRRTAEEKAHDKADKTQRNLERKNNKYIVEQEKTKINWSADGIHGHEIMLFLNE